jgi:hypothetical protein
MTNKIIQDIQDAITSCSQQATSLARAGGGGTTADAAVKYTQAALNASHALNIMYSLHDDVKSRENDSNHTPAMRRP